jgi:hypothetical protein
MFFLGFSIVSSTKQVHVTLVLSEFESCWYRVAFGFDLICLHPSLPRSQFMEAINNHHPTYSYLLCFPKEEELSFNREKDSHCHTYLPLESSKKEISPHDKHDSIEGTSLQKIQKKNLI